MYQQIDEPKPELRRKDLIALSALARREMVPNDFLPYADPVQTPEEKALLTFLGNLKSTAEECVPRYGKSYPNVNKGKRLKEFSFLNSIERSSMEWFKNKPAQQKGILQDCSGTEAEKIVRHYKRRESLGSVSLSESIKYVTDELMEAGVQLSERRFEKLLSLLNDFHNHIRQWCLSGWMPVELSAIYREKVREGS